MWVFLFMSSEIKDTVVAQNEYNSDNQEHTAGHNDEESWAKCGWECRFRLIKVGTTTPSQRKQTKKAKINKQISM